MLAAMEAWTENSKQTSISENRVHQTTNIQKQMGGKFFQ
jgi:hypothetical protein